MMETVSIENTKPSLLSFSTEGEDPLICTLAAQKVSPIPRETFEALKEGKNPDSLRFQKLLDKDILRIPSGNETAPPLPPQVVAAQEEAEKIKQETHEKLEEEAKQIHQELEDDKNKNEILLASMREEFLKPLIEKLDKQWEHRDQAVQKLLDQHNKDHKLLREKLDSVRNLVEEQQAKNETLVNQLSDKNLESSQYLEEKINVSSSKFAAFESQINKMNETIDTKMEELRKALSLKKK